MLRRMFKWSMIPVIGLVGLVAVVGLTRVKTAYWSVRDHLRSNVDELVDTKVALHHEIRKLQKDYPARLGDLKVHIAEIDRDLREVGRDRRLCEEVVALCDSDVAVLEAKVARVSATGTEGHAALIPVEFRAEQMGHNEALTRAGRIAETAEDYRIRLQDLGQEEQVLIEEKARLGAELAEMEREYREFQAEVGGMLRDIESLNRKENLVKVAERRQRNREDIFTDRASGLAVVKEKIDRRKIQLDERLRGLRSFRSGNEYEARARLRLAARPGE